MFIRNYRVYSILKQQKLPLKPAFVLRNNFILIFSVLSWNFQCDISVTILDWLHQCDHSGLATSVWPMREWLYWCVHSGMATSVWPSWNGYISVIILKWQHQCDHSGNKCDHSGMAALVRPFWISHKINTLRLKTKEKQHFLHKFKMMLLRLIEAY